MLFGRKKTKPVLRSHIWNLDLAYSLINKSGLFSGSLTWNLKIKE